MESNTEVVEISNKVVGTLDEAIAILNAAGIDTEVHVMFPNRCLFLLLPNIIINENKREKKEKTTSVEQRIDALHL